MRRVLATLAAVGLLTLILPGAAVAAQPTRVSAWQSGILCEIPSDVGFLSVYVEVSGAGGFASLALWAPDADPFEDLPSIVSDQNSAAFDGTTLTAEFNLITLEEPTDPEQPASEPAGSASVTADLTPSGPEQDFGSREIRDGNRWLRIDETLQLLTVSGNLFIQLLDGRQATASLEGCGSSIYSVTVFGTNPDAWTYGGDQVFVACEWATDLGTVNLLAISEESGALSEVVVFAENTALVGFTTPELSASSYRSSAELFDLAQGMTVGTATADARVVPTGDRISDHTWSPPHRLTTVGERLGVDGTLTLEVNGTTTVLEMDDRACRAGDIRYQVLEKMPHH
ncbi:MAG: hypothetical protein ACRDHD_04360 [Candidatus Limnocylindria bacterium]